MNEFVRSFRQFIYRDAFYILGGITVVFSYTLSYINIRELHWYKIITEPMIIVYIIGISFPIGYLAQSIFNSFGFTTSSIPDSPKWLFKRLFKSFRYEKYLDSWKNARDLETMVFERLKPNEPNLGRLERLIALKQMGTTLGHLFFLPA